MDIYGFSSTTLFFLLGNDVLLPIDTTVTPTLQNGVFVYTYQNPNNADFVYTFNGADTTVGPTGLGYFGTDTIASPQFSCAPQNSGNAFSSSFPNWLSTINGQIDLRGFYVGCSRYANGTYYYNRFIPDSPTLDTTSSYLGSPVAFTT